jgi:hypothetical protein
MLEDRQLMSVVYVSSTAGKDSNNGLSSGSPISSFAKAAAIAKPGDSVLLKAGDSWSQSMGIWSKSCITIGSYGVGAKPRITTAQDGIAIIRASSFTVRGLSFVGINGTSRSGIVTTGGNSNLVIDNCDVTGFRMNITAQGYYGPVYGLRISNSRITRSNGIGMSSGLFADNVKNLVVENSVFDRNGGAGSMYNHGAYLTSSTTDAIVRNNTFSYSSNFGLQARGGGTISGNQFLCNSIGLSVGIVNGSGTHTPGGVVCNVTNNTFSGRGPGLNAGIGMDLGNVKCGLVSGNRFLNGGNLRAGVCVGLSRGNAAGAQVGIRNLKITGNTSSSWGPYGTFRTSNAGLYNVSIAGNNFGKVA